MKPRTKIEREVYALSLKLVPRTSRINKILQRYQKEKCRTYYHVIAERHRDYQVFRFFRVEVHKRKPTMCIEVQQLWYGKGKEIVVARRRTQYAVESFSLLSDLEIRHFGYRYYGTRPSDLGIWTMDIVSLRPEWSRKDLNQVGRISDVQDFSTVRTLSPYMETLYNQHHDIFCKLALNLSRSDMGRLQNEIKVAVRHGYKFPKVILWEDTIELAKRLGIETRNPYYCAPKDVEKLHDQLLKKVRRNEEKEKKKTVEQKIKDCEKAYYKHIKPFLDLLISNGTIDIMPLKTVREVYDEGDMMHHCVYACGYYKLPDVLLMSAQINGKHLETIEFNVESMSIVQCRGLQNRYTEYHQEIIDLLNDNREQIARLRKTA